MIKVVIFDSYGRSGFPVHIQKQITEKTFPENRCGSIIEILESYPSETDTKVIIEKYAKLKVGEVLRGGDMYYLGEKPYNISCKIVEVDNSKNWTIDEYDGAEGIEYLEFECVSEELNYWKRS